MIKELETQFIGGGEVAGFVFTLNKHGVRTFLYEIEKGGGSTHYEVFARKTVPLCIDFAAKQYSTEDFKEIYPKGKDFGVWAWSYRNFEQALKKFNELEAAMVQV